MIVILILKFESAMQLLFTPYLEVLGLCLKTYLLLKIAKIQRIILIFVILLEMKTSSIQNVEIADNFQTLFEKMTKIELRFEF